MFKKSLNNKVAVNATTRAIASVRLWGLRLFLAILFLLAYKMSMAQTKGSAKIYGYKQMVSGGVAPDRSLEPGTNNGSTGGINYYLYLASANNTRIYPSELWIDGTLYGAQAKTVVQTPVTLSSPDPALNERVLVPKTTQKVIHVVPISSNGVKKSAKGELLSKENAVVTIYKQNGKFYYSTLSELSNLETAALQ